MAGWNALYLGRGEFQPDPAKAPNGIAVLIW